MAMINVNRDNPDPFYRYKMPSLIAKVTHTHKHACTQAYIQKHLESSRYVCVGVYMTFSLSLCLSLGGG